MLARAARLAAAAALRLGASRPPLTPHWISVEATPAAVAGGTRGQGPASLRALTAPARADPPEPRKWREAKPKPFKKQRARAKSPLPGGEKRKQGRPRTREPQPPRKPASPPPPSRPWPPVLPPWSLARTHAMAAIVAVSTQLPPPPDRGVKPRPRKERDAATAARLAKSKAARAARAVALAAEGGELDAAPMDTLEAMDTDGTPCVGFTTPRPARPPPPPPRRGRRRSPRAVAPAAVGDDVDAARAVLAGALPPDKVDLAITAFLLGHKLAGGRPFLPTSAHLASVVAAFMGAGGTPHSLAVLAAREPAALARADAAETLSDFLRALTEAGVPKPSTVLDVRPRAAMEPAPGAHVRQLASYLSSLGLPRDTIGRCIQRVPVLTVTPMRHITSAVAALSGVAGLRGPALASALAACPALVCVHPTALAVRARWAAAELGADAAALASAPSVLVRPLVVVGGRRAAAVAAGKENEISSSAYGADTTRMFAEVLGVPKVQVEAAMADWTRCEDGQKWLAQEGRRN